MTMPRDLLPTSFVEGRRPATGRLAAPCGAAALALVLAAGCGEAAPVAAYSPIVAADSPAALRALAQSEQKVREDRRAEARMWRRLHTAPPSSETEAPGDHAASP